MLRSILFIDPPAFCTTVSGLDRPRLRGRPVAIAPLAADRAVLLAVSTEARAAGITPGMAASLAQRACPDLVILPPDPERYARAHQALYRILSRVAPVIEPRGWGHAYLDLTGTDRLFGSPAAVADRIGRETRTELRLPLVVGVAPNKLVSVAAAATAKRDHEVPVRTIPPGSEAGFLAPEPVSLLPDIQSHIRSRLHDYHLEVIGELADIGESSLRQVFGSEGLLLHQHACGIDHRAVIPPAVRTACRVAVLLPTDTNDRNILRATVSALAERLELRLLQRRLAASRLTLVIRYSDDITANRTTPPLPGKSSQDLRRSAIALLHRLLARRVTVRSCTLRAEGLRPDDVQLELFQ